MKFEKSSLLRIYIRLGQSLSSMDGFDGYATTPCVPIKIHFELILHKFIYTCLICLFVYLSIINNIQFLIRNHVSYLIDIIFKILIIITFHYYSLWSITIK